MVAVRTAVLFPGQGAQKVGMGRDLFEKSPAARALFEEADRILGEPLSKACFEGPEDLLNSTRVSQPALFTTSLAVLAALRERGVDLSGAFWTAGLSLGEYTALAFAGALSFEDGLRLVRLRGERMQAACDRAPSGMTSLLGADLATAEAVCREASAAGIVVVANINAMDQIVISGEIPALERAEAVAKAKGVRRAIRLKTAGAFHSPCMKPADDELAEALKAVRIQAPRIPVFSNVTAQPERDPERIRGLLARQVVSPVLWAQTASRLPIDGVRRVVEPGPGRVICGMLKKSGFDLELLPLEGWEDVVAASAAKGEGA